MIVKVCGMRDANNIKDVEQLQPDMMGFICWQKSKRNVSEIPSYLPDVCRVGVFVDPSEKEVCEMVKLLGLNRIQLHGHESRDFCHMLYEKTGLPITKAISVSDWMDLEQYHEYAWEPAVDMYLFDTKCPGKGGSGEQFDWNIIHSYNGHKPFLLAGGIGPEDVEHIRNFSHPRFLGVDLNSCFEMEPGVKDVRKLEDFINKIRK